MQKWHAIPIAFVFALSVAAQSVPPSELRIYSAGEESRLVLLSATANAETRSVAVVIQNVSDVEMKSLTLHGLGFRQGKRVGGFAVTVPTVVYAHGYVNLSATVQPNFLSNVDVVLLSTEPIAKVGDWRGEGRLFDVDVATSGHLIGGENLTAESQVKLRPEPNLPADGGCCASCFTQAQGCGKNPLKSGTCTGACTSYYSCSYTLSSDGSYCASSTCTYNCRDSSTCC